jgi:hypothetical protein
MATWYKLGTEPQRGEYHWTVKDKEGDEVWIAGEPTGDPLKVIGIDGDDLGVGFELPPGTTFEEAREVAKFMNEWISQIVLS